MAIELAPWERKIFDLFTPGEDVKIDDIFAAFRDPNAESGTPRQRQQQAGSVIAGINKKLAAAKLRIVPGEARRTYRLVRQVG